MASPETYRDPSATVTERTADLLGRMTVDEKVAQLGAVWVTDLLSDGRFDEKQAMEALDTGVGHVTRIGASTALLPIQSAQLMNDVQHVLVERTRLGIPAVVHEEAVGGFCHRGATVFPQAIGLASTWDPDLMAAVGDVIREQMLAVGARHALSPVLDVARDPRWGRLEETYGESPYLCGRMGVAYVRALQTDDLEHGVACTGKHFLGYSAPIGGRNQAPVHLGPRELREVYAEPFSAVIREARLASVMNSYSSVDGLPCAGSDAILTTLLRDELGFAGAVVADYYSVRLLRTAHRCAADAAEAAVMALTAGLDMELPAVECFSALPDLVRTGRLDEAVVDRAVERVLALKFRLGLFEAPYVEPERAGAVFDSDGQRALARRAAAHSICLLTNDGTLPIDVGTVRHVAVIGPAADDERLLQGDYHYPAHLEVMADRAPEPAFTEHVTPLGGLRAALDGDIALVHVRGCDVRDANDADLDAAAEAAASADLAIVFVGGRSGLSPTDTVGEARDAVSLDLTGAQPRLLDAVLGTGTPTVVVVVSGRAHTLGDVADRAAALLYAWVPGEEGGHAIADVLTGVVNPAGRLPVTLPRHVGQLPLHHDMRSTGDRSTFWGEYVDCSVEPRFPFGHGLSYTTFEYGSLEVDRATTASTTEPVTLRVEVRNTGLNPGAEVVQLYVRDVVASVARPILQLVGFRRAEIDAGAARTITFTVHPSRLAFFDQDMRLVTEPGEFRFGAGASATDIRAEATVTLAGERAEYRQRDIVDTLVRVD